MKRLCMDCNERYGEKCSQCGSIDVVMRCMYGAGRFAGMILEFFWACPKCQRTWYDGHDGESHGLCAGCHQNRLDQPNVEGMEALGA